MKISVLIKVSAIILFSGGLWSQKTSFYEESSLAAPLPILNKFMIGARFMPSSASIKVDQTKGYINDDVVFGQGYGGLIAFNLTKHIGFQAEVIYNILSQKYKNDDFAQRIDLKYFNIPLLLSLNSSRERKINLNFVAGPQIGMNVGSKLTSESFVDSLSNSPAVLSVKKGVFDLVYGAGLDFGLNSNKTIRLDVGFRGLMGLVDLNDSKRTLETGSYYILKNDRMQSYSVYVGLLFIL